MNKSNAIRYLQSQGRDLSFIANVFQTSGGPNSTRTLKAIAALVQRGVSVSTASLYMPYEYMLVDGAAMTPQWLRGYEVWFRSEEARLEKTRRWPPLQG